MADHYIHKIMEEREDLLEAREKLFGQINALSDKLEEVNNRIINDPWIIKNKIPYWTWRRGLGFVFPKPKVKKERKPKAATTKLDDLIRIVKKEPDQLPELSQQESVLRPKKESALQFTYYPDTMEEKAYKTA